MKSCSRDRIRDVERPLLEYLEGGGEIVSWKGVHLIAAFVKVAMQEKEIADVAAKYGMDESDLGNLYIHMLKACPVYFILPCSHLLAPTVFFLDPSLLESIGDAFLKNPDNIADRERLAEMIGSITGETIYGSNKKDVRPLPCAAASRPSDAAAAKGGCLIMAIAFAAAILIGIMIGRFLL